MRSLLYPLLALFSFSALIADEEYDYDFTTFEYPKEECSTCKGKFDTGPAYINIDVLQNGKTFRSLNLFAWKFDGLYEVYKGFTLKAGGMVGGGEADFYTLSGGAGFCIPFKSFTFFPNAGYGFGKFKSTFDLHKKIYISGFDAPIRLFFDNVKEDIDTHGPYVGIDISYKINKTWRVVFAYQYAWSNADTEYKWKSDDENFLPSIDEDYRTKTSGPNYAIQLEHDFNDNFSVNLGAGYNMTLSRDKEGLRAKGAKLGFVYWF